MGILGVLERQSASQVLLSLLSEEIAFSNSADIDSPVTPAPDDLSNAVNRSWLSALIESDNRRSGNIDTDAAVVSRISVGSLTAKARRMNSAASNGVKP